THILRVLVIGGLFYSLLMLFELRMGPQLHVWLYGYTPTDMDIDVRGDGFRPRVFLENGLSVALFTATTVLAAAALWRGHIRVQRMLPSGGVATYLVLMLMLCKSAAAFMYGAALMPMI